jgi:hypothetical protein
MAKNDKIALAKVVKNDKNTEGVTSSNFGKKNRIRI